MSLRRAIILICCLFSFGTSQAATVLHNSEGEAVNVSSFKGKWVVVNYWATWCGYCLDEMPGLNSFYQHNKDKDVLMYGVNYDHLTGGELKKAIRELGISFPVLQDDPDSVWGFGYSSVLPVTYVINPSGKIAKKFVGPTDEQSISEVIQLSEKK